MSLLDAATLLGGLLLLFFGAELLVRGASRMAAAFGISPLVIGLTVVAFATSAPELAVTLRAAAAGQPDIAVGNVVGSNIFNVLCILGMSALVIPLQVSRRLVRVDVPLMIAVSVGFYVMALDRSVSRLDGLLLFVAVVTYTVWLVRSSRAENNIENTGRADAAPPRLLSPSLTALAGLGLLVLGANGVVNGAVAIARAWGLSELIVGLTIIAAGTSLPEAATSIVAAVRGERDIAVGNAIGSNLFNILAVMGMTALVAPGGVPVAGAALAFDLPVMIAVAVACLPIFFTGGEITRWEGALFLAYFVAYTLYLILDATGHDALPRFSSIMLQFVLPLTVLTLLILAARALHRERR